MKDFKIEVKQKQVEETRETLKKLCKKQRRKEKYGHHKNINLNYLKSEIEAYQNLLSKQLKELDELWNNSNSN